MSSSVRSEKIALPKSTRLIGFDQLELAAVDVEQHELRQVGADVAFDVHALAVLVEALRIARLEHRTAEDLGEAAVFDAQHFGIAIGGAARHEPQFSGPIEQ